MRGRNTEREREREKGGSDVTLVELKLAMSLHFSLPKNFTLVPPLSLRAELTLRVAKNIALFETFIFPRKYCSFRFVSVKWGVKESNKLNKG